MARKVTARKLSEYLRIDISTLRNNLSGEYSDMPRSCIHSGEVKLYQFDIDEVMKYIFDKYN